MAIFFSTRVEVGDKGGAELAGNLRNLLEKNSSALRIECIEKNGAQVIYIRDRNIFDYIWEKLDADESELIRMRTNAREVLHTNIRPLIQGEKIWDGSGVALWKKIEERILDIHAPDKIKSNPHSLNGVQLMYVKPSDQLLSVPDGLSVCKASPSMFIASKIILAKNMSSDQNSISQNAGKTMGYKEWPEVAKNKEMSYKDVKEFYLNEFRNLGADIKAHSFSMVIEPILHPLDEDDQLSRSHIEGLVGAVKKFIRENKKINKTVSLVIATENNSSYLALRDKILSDAVLGNDEVKNPERYEILSRLESPLNSYLKPVRRTPVGSIPTVRDFNNHLDISDD